MTFKYLRTERGLDTVIAVRANGFTTRQATFWEKMLWALRHREWPHPVKYSLPEKL